MLKGCVERLDTGEMVRRVVGGVGRTLITTGVLLLLFVGYQLWGTGIATARSQDRLGSAVEAQLAAEGIKLPDIPDALTGPTIAPIASTTTMAPADTDPSTVQMPTTTSMAPVPTTTGPELVSHARTKALALRDGDAIGQIVVPRIGLKKYLVEGTSVEALRKGPGHYAGTPQPGEPGNVAIAGHRTTYGGPFFRMDEMRAGDPIFVFSLKTNRWFRYDVMKTTIVKPSASEVLRPIPGLNTLTLTTCHPRYSASQRMVISATLVGEAVEADTQVVAPDPVVTTVAPTTSAAPVSAPGTTLLSPTTVATTTVATTTVATTTVATTTLPPMAPGDGSVGGDGDALSLDGRRADSSQFGFSLLRGPTRVWSETVMWAAICALIWMSAWIAVRHRRQLLTRALGYSVVFVVVFIPALYFCFENLARLLPENV